MLKYRNLQIQHKLIASFAVILAVVLVLAVSNYVANSRIGSLSTSLEENAYMAYKDGSSLVDVLTGLSFDLSVDDFLSLAEPGLPELDEPWPRSSAATARPAMKIRSTNISRPQHITTGCCA